MDTYEDQQQLKIQQLYFHMLYMLIIILIPAINDGQGLEKNCMED